MWMTSVERNPKEKIETKFNYRVHRGIIVNFSVTFVISMVNFLISSNSTGLGTPGYRFIRPIDRHFIPTIDGFAFFQSKGLNGVCIANHLTL